MSKKIELIGVLGSALLFTFLFYEKALGINLLIFELVLMGWYVANRKVQLKNRNQITLFAGWMLTLLATVVSYSIMAYIWHLICLGLLVALLAYPRVRSLLSTFWIGLSGLLISQKDFYKQLTGFSVKGKSIRSSLKGIRYFFIPLIIIFVFLGIYRYASPVFDDMMGQMFGSFFDLFSDLEIALVMTFLLGVLISNFLLLNRAHKDIIRGDERGEDTLYRRKKIRSSAYIKMMGLSNECKSAVFLFLILNALLMVVNIVDIYAVWFGFEWEGQYLKRFVHEGAYMLILSIFLSIGLVLYFFRRNLNFYQKNQLLKTLSYIWLAQNALLAISVGVRNYWYIYYFSLAYKRIAVLVFLLMVLYSLYTVSMKLKENKTFFYLNRKNVYVLYLLITVSSLFNWDVIIARYNFAHAGNACLHYDFMSRLSDKALPWLDVGMEELEEIQKAHVKNFPHSKPDLPIEDYYSYIEKRKDYFLTQWEKKHWLSWNYAEYKAYINLKNSKE